MKLVWSLVMALSFASQAVEIKVSKMSRDGGLDRSFVLKTNLQDKVVIDCQSFIQGLRIGEYEQAYTYLLDPEQCDGLQFRIKNSLRKYQYHCILAEDEIHDDYACN